MFEHHSLSVQLQSQCNLQPGVLPPPTSAAQVRISLLVITGKSPVLGQVRHCQSGHYPRAIAST